MYESMTYEDILQAMLNEVSNAHDKREGSIIYDSLAPTSVQLAKFYTQLNGVRDMTFVNTSVGSYLDELVNDIRGMKRIQATKAVVTGTFNIDVPIGSRFNGDILNYVVTEKVSDGVFLMECETAGTEGNHYVGVLVPIDYIQGLATAEITEISIPAIDTETDEALRARFYDSFTAEAKDGNIAQYKKWIAEYPTVGKGKIFPLWNGKNTVKVSILNTENEVASQTLVNEFQEYLDPGSTGLGNGIAPIGAIVTVSTATETVINITVDVYLQAGYESATDVEDAVKNLFKEMAYSSSVVNFYEVAMVISSCDSVARISNLKVNSAMEDIILGDEEIPVLGSLNVQVVTA